MFSFVRIKTDSDVEVTLSSSESSPRARVQFGVPEGQRLAAAEILFDAFRHKLLPMFGSRPTAIDIIAAGLRDDRTVVAVEAGKVIGVAVLKLHGKESLELGLWNVARSMGHSFLRFILMAPAFFGRVRVDEVLLDMLAVQEEHRGKGTGRAIMEYIISHARAHHFSRVKLYVVKDNERAREFYESLGVRVLGHRYLLPFSLPMGFRSAYEMGIDL